VEFFIFEGIKKRAKTVVLAPLSLPQTKIALQFYLSIVCPWIFNKGVYMNPNPAKSEDAYCEWSQFGKPGLP